MTTSPPPLHPARVRRQTSDLDRVIKRELEELAAIPRKPNGQLNPLNQGSA